MIWKERPILKDIVIIYYGWWAGNCNMGFWTAELNGEIMDYHTQDNLIKQAEELNKEWIVLKYHKGKLRGQISLVKHSQNINIKNLKQ